MGVILFVRAKSGVDGRELERRLPCAEYISSRAKRHWLPIGLAPPNKLMKRWGARAADSAVMEQGNY